MKIKRLLLVGENKPNAEVGFKKGINIISGVSDTGKSFIYQCINYVLCSDEKPKEIDESKGYNKIVLEMLFNNELYTIIRELNKKIVKVYSVQYEEIDEKISPLILNAKHDDKKNNNLSKWLLDKLFNKKHIKVLKKKDHPRGISFRDLIHFCCSDEEKIIGNCSPFFTNQVIKETEYKSIFDFLISGKDYSDVVKRDYKKEKANKEAYLEILNEQIDALKAKIKELNTDISNKKTDVDLINKTNEEIRAISNEINALNKKICVQNDKLNNKNVNLLEFVSQLESFNALSISYDSQLKETQIINNFADVLDQMPTCKCPLCKQVLNIEILEINDISNINQYNQSSHNKLQLLKNELEKTIDGLNIKIKNLEKEIQKLKLDIEKDRLKLEDKIKYLNIKNEEILKLKQVHINIMKLEMYKENLERLLANKESIKDKNKNTKSKKEQRVIDNIESYCSQLKNVIDVWTSKNNIITFDYKTNDIAINGKNRTSFGKGFKAFYSSAMIIALQRYLKNKGLMLPGFVMIDSPLVSLKEQKKFDRNDRLVDDYMQTNMINDLISNAELGQVIIFENKEFDKFKGQINYIFYSESGSDGFIPIN